MTKEKFCEIINNLKEANEVQTQMYYLLYNSRSARDSEIVGLQIVHEGIVVELLKEIMDDKFDQMDYWIYELNYGRLYEDGCVTFDGNSIDLSTPELLYDFLS